VRRSIAVLVQLGSLLRWDVAVLLLGSRHGWQSTGMWWLAG
jgi:hypothetical protein